MPHPSSCSCGEHPEVCQLLRIDEAHDRFVEGDAGGDEDGEHDCEAGELLAADGAQEEGDPERDGGERVAEVVDQVDEPVRVAVLAMFMSTLDQLVHAVVGVGGVVAQEASRMRSASPSLTCSMW